MPLCDAIHDGIEFLPIAGYISLDFSYLSPKQPILELLQSSFALIRKRSIFVCGRIKAQIFLSIEVNAKGGQVTFFHFK